MKQVIVTGGRDYDDWAMVQSVLSFINPDVIIQGGASGADKLAKEWAEINNKDSTTMPANWQEYGKSAGPRRNVEMLNKYPNAFVVAFPGGKGTAHCVSIAAQLNRIVLQVHR